jgi:hypothetical protein
MNKIKPRTKKIKEFKTIPDTSITNEYNTTKNGLRSPYLMIAVGVRNTGKSFTTAKILAQAHKDNLYDRYFMISPTYDSNKKYWNFLGDKLDEADIFYPTRDSIDSVIAEIEKERDMWEDYVIQKKLYDRFKEVTKNRNSIGNLDFDEISLFIDAGFINDEGDITDVEEPQWHRDIVRPAQSCLICDDILGSSALGNAQGLTKLAIMNRHLAPLNEPFGNRAALGCACIFLTQSYSGGGGGSHNGIPKALRLNATHLIFFQNKSEAVMKKITEELGGVISEDMFMAAFKFAVREKHDNLMIDLNPKCPTKKFRRNLDEFIIFPEQEKECNCHKK